MTLAAFEDKSVLIEKSQCMLFTQMQLPKRMYLIFKLISYVSNNEKKNIKPLFR